MAKAAYIGVSSKARKVKNIYVGIDGKARKVKKGYIGVNGVARLFYELKQYTITISNPAMIEGSYIELSDGQLLIESGTYTVDEGIKLTAYCQPSEAYGQIITENGDVIEDTGSGYTMTVTSNLNISIARKRITIEKV